jgi:hypothetical protein
MATTHFHREVYKAGGEAAYVVHRAKIGDTGGFLPCVRAQVGPQVPARWYMSPWPPQAPSTVLVVRHVHAPVLEQGAEA